MIRQTAGNPKAARPESSRRRGIAAGAIAAAALALAACGRDGRMDANVYRQQVAPVLEGQGEDVQRVARGTRIRIKNQAIRSDMEAMLGQANEETKEFVGAIPDRIKALDGKAAPGTKVYVEGFTSNDGSKGEQLLVVMDRGDGRYNRLVTYTNENSSDDPTITYVITGATAPRYSKGEKYLSGTFLRKQGGGYQIDVGSTLPGDFTMYSTNMNAGARHEVGGTEAVDVIRKFRQEAQGILSAAAGNKP